MSVLLGLGDVHVAAVELEHRVRGQPVDRLLVVRNDRPIFRRLETFFLSTSAGLDDVIEICRVRSYHVVIVALEKSNLMAIFGIRHFPESNPRRESGKRECNQRAVSTFPLQEQ